MNFESYRDLLGTYTVDQLKNLGQLVGLKKLPIKKGELVNELAKTPFELVVSQMSEIQKTALASALYHPKGVLDLVKFKAQHGVDPYGVSNRWGSRSSILDWYIFDNRIAQTLVIELKKLLPPPPKNKVETLDSASHYLTMYAEDEFAERVTERDSFQNIKTILQLVDSGKISASAQTGIPSASVMKMINEHLKTSEFDHFGITAFAVPQLLLTGGYVSQSGTKLAITPKGKKVLTGSLNQSEIASQLWKSWCSKGTDELRRIPLIKGQRTAGTLTAPKGRRESINETLSKLPVNEWIDISELGRFMRASGNSFEVARNRWNLYFYDKQYGSLGYDGHGEWNILQERYIKVLFLEYYAILGLIDIIETRPENCHAGWGSIWGLDDEEYISIYDGLLAFRINSLGAYVFGITDSYESVAQETTPLLEVLPNNDIVIPHIHTLETVDRLYLDKIATQSSGAVWKLSQKSILSAVECGETISNIEQFLTDRAHHELPQTVTALLKECSTRVVPLKNKGMVSLFECNDRTFLQRISADLKMKELCVVADTVLIPLPSKEKEFFKRISAMGFVVPQ